MPRPITRLTEAQRAEVETLAAVLTTGQIADYFGIGRTTFFAILERDADVAERYKRGKAKAIGAIAQSLIAEARAGDTASMIFYFKVQGGLRERHGIEHSGPDGGPVHVTHAREQVTETLNRLGRYMRAAQQKEAEAAQQLESPLSPAEALRR